MKNSLRDVARRFSTSFPVMLDLDRRKKKGRKVTAILEDALAGQKVDVVIDVGCSNALILDVVTQQLMPGLAIGIDLDAAIMPQPQPRRSLLIADGMALPIHTGYVDLVICNHTYEHVPDAEQLFAEIWRVLRPGGLVYFSAMNARWPMEPHFHLPFIHWLPHWMSIWPMRMAGHHHGYIERPLGTAALRRLVSKFEIRDYTLRAIREPERFEADDLMPRSALRRIYLLFARLAYGFLPGYLWILVKPAAESKSS
jgi:SAM-dependent methyltransferase